MFLDVVIVENERIRFAYSSSKSPVRFLRCSLSVALPNQLPGRVSHTPPPESVRAGVLTYADVMTKISRIDRSPRRYNDFNASAL